MRRLPEGPRGWNTRAGRAPRVRDSRAEFNYPAAKKRLGLAFPAQSVDNVASADFLNMLLVGTRLGPYEVISRIGAGGMGEVWRARDTRLERDVAVKILPAEFASNAQLKLRFEREAKTISQLNHPHICVLHDVGEARLETRDSGLRGIRASSLEPRASPTSSWIDR
ncbi:MAG: protein kinase [Acidobacteria bacterium]|nr:protein kinase [Acidobacteriota bacterium]